MKKRRDPEERKTLKDEVQVGSDLLAPKRQCTAKSKATGQQCKRYVALGMRTCNVHGSATRRSKVAAAKRIAQASGFAAELLVEFMADPSVELKTRVQIAQDLLNRAGVAGKQGIEFSGKTVSELYANIVLESTIPITGPKPDNWDESFDGPWEAFIRPGQPHIIDAEIVEDAEHERALDAHTEATERERAKRRRKRLNPELPPSVARGLPAPRSHSIEEDPRTRPKQPSPEEDITSGREAFLRERLADDKKPRRTQRSRG